MLKKLWTDGPLIHVLPLSADGYTINTDGSWNIIDYQPKAKECCAYCGTLWIGDSYGRCKSCGGYQTIS